LTLGGTKREQLSGRWVNPLSHSLQYRLPIRHTKPLILTDLKLYMNALANKPSIFRHLGKGRALALEAAHENAAGHRPKANRGRMRPTPKTENRRGSLFARRLLGHRAYEDALYVEREKRVRGVNVAQHQTRKSDWQARSSSESKPTKTAEVPQRQRRADGAPNAQGVRANFRFLGTVLP